MADIQKSVEISYKANVKQLLDSLKSIPNVTEQEAKKMVKGLQRQLAQSERAAKKAGINSAKGMKRFSTSTRQASRSVANLRKESANLDRLTGELAAGIDMINPAMGQLFHVASGAAGAIEGVARGMQLTNPLLLLATVGITTLGGAYYMFTAASKIAAERQKELGKAALEASGNYNVAGQKIDDLTRKLEELNQAQTDNLEQNINQVNQELDDQLFGISAVDKAQRAADKRRNKFINAHLKSMTKEKTLLKDRRDELHSQVVSLEKLAEQQVSSGKINQALYRETTSNLFKTKLEARAAGKEYRAIGKEMQTIQRIQKEGLKLKAVPFTGPDFQTFTGHGLTENSEEFQSNLRVFDAKNKQIKELEIVKEKDAEADKNRSKGMSKRQKNYNAKLQETIGLLNSMASIQTKLAAIETAAESQTRSLKIANLELQKKMIDRQLKQAEGAEKLELLSKSQEMAVVVLGRKQDENTLKLQNQFKARQDNLSKANEAVAAAEKQLDLLKSQNRRYRNTKNTKEAEKKLEEAITAQKQIQKGAIEAQQSLNFALGEQRINHELQLQDLEAAGADARQNAIMKEDKLKEAAAKKAFDMNVKALADFKGIADGIAASQAAMWDIQIQKSTDQQAEIVGRIDKMVTDGVITQQEGDERKQKSADRFAKKKFQTEMKLYKLRKATATADVIFNTAKAITAMLVYPPPFGPMLAAGVAMAGAAELVAIQSAPAPTMHRGGMVPDETNIKALSGEAVLNRQTVQGLGGSEGINRLNRGGGLNETVVVIQPFKHFDKFVRSGQRRGILATPTAKTGSGRY